MAAPRLLEKRLANAEVADQKRHQITQGIALAKKVDAVRESLAEEEARLSLFRDSTLARVQGDIDAKIHERDSLEQENGKLREERLRLLAPIDLSEAWSEVNILRDELTDWKDRLTSEQIEVLSLKEENKLIANNLLNRELNIERKDILAESYLLKSEEKMSAVEHLAERLKQDTERIGREHREREYQLALREQETTEMEKDLEKREKVVRAHAIDLADRETQLKVRYDTFIKAQNYIKRK